MMSIKILSAIQCILLITLAGVGFIFTSNDTQVILEQNRRSTVVDPLSASIMTNDQCVDLGRGGDLDTLIAKSSSVFLTMPAKAAGCSLKYFVQECQNVTIRDNVINNKEKYHQFLTDSYKLPKIIASHTYSDEALLRLFQQTTKNTLIVYIYREETDRLLSGIEQVVHSLCTGQHFKYLEDIDVKIENAQENVLPVCTVDEQNLIKIISDKRAEIGFGTLESLTCSVYNAIRESSRKVVMINYKQSGRLQEIIRRQLCPTQAVHNYNVAKTKKNNMRVQIKNGTTVTVHDWLDVKRDYLQWTLDLNKNASCQGETEKMEDILFSCNDEAIYM